jgi:hypothetical protein
MRQLALILLLVAMPVAASAAPVSGLDGLLATRHASAAHKPAHGRAAAKPAAPMAAATAPAVEADAAAPVPLPRPRPMAPAPLPPAGLSPAAKDSGSPAATTAPAVPAAPAGPQSTPLEGESATPKPPRIYQTACPAVIAGLVEAKPLPPISDGACGNASPLSVTGIFVNGRMLPLTAPATFGCEMATDLPGWVADVDNYLQSTQKTRIKAVEVGGSYECRPRNVEGGSSDLSEHGRADALDFVGFALEDGRTLTVTNDYNSADAPTSRLMHFAHDAACTRFTTVLGPDANALHHDHFHLDLGCHGKTCTYRLCE